MEVSFANFAELCETTSQSANPDDTCVWTISRNNLATLRPEYRAPKKTKEVFL